MDTLEEAVYQLIRKAHFELPQDVETVIRTACDAEEGVAKTQLENILKNLEIAKTEEKPMCQDTGTHFFFVGGENLDTKSIETAIKNALLRAEQDIPLRKNCFDPLTGEQKETKPFIEYHSNPEFRIDYLPKGGGSEAKSAYNALAIDKADEIPDIIAKIVKEAGANPCPPVILGVGIGGSFNIAAGLAKQALLEDINKSTELEKKILDKVNELGIGPMGLGGKTTCLGVNIKQAERHPTHIPLAVNIQCWANRHTSIVKKGDEYDFA